MNEGFLWAIGMICFVGWSTFVFLLGYGQGRKYTDRGWPH